MREITTHKVNGLNECIQIHALDEPGDGGANHHYRLKLTTDRSPRADTWDIYFQNGPIREAGANGLSNEALLAVLIDRMQGFQSGKFACEENGYALDHLLLAMADLRRRTRSRLERGVEGTHAP